MVPCHSCHIYGILTSRSKKVKGMLRSYQLGGWGVGGGGGGNSSNKKGIILIGKTDSH